MAKLTEEDCMDAILQHANENCCYGTKPAQEMKITKIEGITALHVSRNYIPANELFTPKFFLYVRWSSLFM